MLIRTELEGKCKSLLFLCLSQFNNELNSSEFVDLVFEEWQQSPVAERNSSYKLTSSLFFETVKVLSVRQMGLEAYTLFKEFTSFMLVANLPIPYFSYPLINFINQLST